jgi:hypothetical protein
MSSSMYVVGFIPPDENWRRMKAIWDACHAAGVSQPPIVEKFFGGERPDDNGREVTLASDIPGLKDADGCKYWHDDDYCREGFEIELAKLPPEIKILRFFNSQ